MCVLSVDVYLRKAAWFLTEILLLSCCLHNASTSFWSDCIFFLPHSAQNSIHRYCALHCHCDTTLIMIALISCICVFGHYSTQQIREKMETASRFSGPQSKRMLLRLIGTSELSMNACLFTSALWWSLQGPTPPSRYDSWDRLRLPLRPWVQDKWWQNVGVWVVWCWTGDTNSGCWQSLVEDRTTRYVVFVVLHWLRCFPVSRSPKSPFLRVAHCHRGAVSTWGALWQGGGAMLRIDGCNKIRPGVIHYMIDTLVSGINYTYEISAFDLQYLTKPYLTRQTGSFVMKVRSQTGISEDDLSLEGSCRDWTGILAPQISCQREMNTFHLWKNSLTFWKKNRLIRLAFQQSDERIDTSPMSVCLTESLAFCFSIEAGSKLERDGMAPSSGKEEKKTFCIVASLTSSWP